jgi:hypothetical protein
MRSAETRRVSDRIFRIREFSRLIAAFSNSNPLELQDGSINITACIDLERSAIIDHRENSIIFRCQE